MRDRRVRRRRGLPPPLRERARAPAPLVQLNGEERAHQEQLVATAMIAIAGAHSTRQRPPNAPPACTACRVARQPRCGRAGRLPQRIAARRRRRDPCQTAAPPLRSPRPSLHCGPGGERGLRGEQRETERRPDGREAEDVAGRRALPPLPERGPATSPPPARRAGASWRRSSRATSPRRRRPRAPAAARVVAAGRRGPDIGCVSASCSHAAAASR